KGLSYAGINVVNIANNHIYNFGGEGRAETIQILKGAGIGISGEEQIHYREAGGTRFAFLGFDVVGKHADRAAVSSALQKARANSDVVLVQFHWGQEYTYSPRAAGEDPISLGRFAVEAGADLVIGNHPHWVQGIEFYRGKPIVYSHGNFVFDQMWSQETREGVVGKYVFYRGRLVDIEFLPVLIDSPFVPRFLSGNDKIRMLGIIEEASRLLQRLAVLK
ncbi:MAG: CapA family protein, partial [bacterium]|nr:CapA family protein [bacterium]